MAGTSGRTCSISAALPFALRHPVRPAEAEERCRQRLRPGRDPAGGNPLSAKLLQSVKLGWKSLKRFLINVNSFFFFLQQSKALVYIHIPLRFIQSEVSLLSGMHSSSFCFHLSRTEGIPVPAFPKKPANQSPQNTTSAMGRAGRALQAGFCTLRGRSHLETRAKVETGFNFI